jgi:uncharacterized protein (DUF427 family)
MRAVWNGTVIAESDKTVVVEGNHYFPSDSLVAAHFRKNSATTVCPWKGTANYFDVIVGDKVNERAAWTYKTPKDAAQNIANYVAFWRGVEVIA